MHDPGTMANEVIADRIKVVAVNLARPTSSGELSPEPWTGREKWI